jgi:anaerobic glycerol-3-phosphate dehydrogenase
MWHNNLSVSRVYTSHHSQNCYAIVSGVSGWKKVKTGSGDGVTNVHIALSAAIANGRKVDVYIVSNMIERVTLR